MLYKTRKSFALMKINYLISFNYKLGIQIKVLFIMKQAIGKTKSEGFQFGIRKTFPIQLENAWDFMFSEKGLDIWLGKIEEAPQLLKEFRTQDGYIGKIRLLKPYSHFRMLWQKPEWQQPCLLQVRFIPNKEKTCISFHLEKLLDTNQRSDMKKHWTQAIERLTLEVIK